MSGWTRQWTLFTLVLLIAHILLHVALGLGAAAPDLLMVAALLGARRLPTAGAAGLGFFLGILADTFAVTGFGATAFALALVCGIGSLSQDFFEGESLIFNGIYLLAGAILATLLADVVSGRGTGGFLPGTLGVFGAAGYTALAGSATLWVYRRWAGLRA